jgi:hypothetical protein
VDRIKRPGSKVEKHHDRPQFHVLSIFKELESVIATSQRSLNQVHNLIFARYLSCRLVNIVVYYTALPFT